MCSYTMNMRFLRLIRKHNITVLSEWIGFIEEFGSVLGPEVLNDEYIESLPKTKADYSSRFDFNRGFVYYWFFCVGSLSFANYYLP